MQPITQVSLDPQCDDIRHLRADQGPYGLTGFFAQSPRYPVLTPSAVCQRPCTHLVASRSLLTRGKRPQGPMARSGSGTAGTISHGSQPRFPPHCEGTPTLSVSSICQFSKPLPEVMQTWNYWLKRDMDRRIYSSTTERER